MNIKVNLPGHGVFRMHLEPYESEIDEYTNAALTPLDHCDAEGNLIPEKCFRSDSYAHLARGVILRYGVQIGTWRDLVPCATVRVDGPELGA